MVTYLLCACAFAHTHTPQLGGGTVGHPYPQIQIALRTNDVITNRITPFTQSVKGISRSNTNKP